MGETAKGGIGRSPGRTPVGGPGTKSKRLVATLRMPLWLYNWTVARENVAAFIRGLLKKAYDEEKNRPFEGGMADVEPPTEARDAQEHSADAQ